MSVIDMYMKELSCGQKIIYEEMLMHQQNINRNFLPQQQPLNNNIFRIMPQQQQQYFQQLPFSSFSANNNYATTNINFPTSNSVFSSLPPNSFTTMTSNKPQHFSHSNSTFTQQQYPPLFDPFASAVAANFMQHFTQNNNQQQSPTTFFNTENNNYLRSKATKPSLGMAPSLYSNFAFPQFGAVFSPSPSYCSLNSVGTSAVDSLPSSCIPSSPDDSSCSLDSEISIINEYKNKIEVSDQNESKKEDYQSKKEESIEILENDEKVPVRWVNCKEMFPDEDGIFERLAAERTKIEAKENVSKTDISAITSLENLQSSEVNLSSNYSSTSHDEEIIIIEYNKKINEFDKQIDSNNEDYKPRNEKNLEIQNLENEKIVYEKVDENIICEHLKIENTTTELDENTKNSPSVSSLNYFSFDLKDDVSCSSLEENNTQINECEENIESDNQNESNKEDTQSDQEDQKSPQKLKNGKIPCRWASCKEMFHDEDGLYDHLTLAHVDALTKWVIAEQREIEKQQKNGCELKRRRCGSNISIENVKERFRCQWRKCEQYPRRGDAQKKLDWLLNHLLFRHAPKSRPHKCLFEGCFLRFSKVGTLRDHIRCTHNETKNKQNGRKSLEEKNNIKITCFEFRPHVRFQFVNDCIDSRTIQWARSEMLLTKDKKEAKIEREFRRRKRNKAENEENTKIKKEILTSEKNIILPRRISVNEATFHLKSLFKRACKTKLDQL